MFCVLAGLGTDHTYARVVLAWHGKGKGKGKGGRGGGRGGKSRRRGKAEAWHCGADQVSKSEVKHLPRHLFCFILLRSTCRPGNSLPSLRWDEAMRACVSRSAAVSGFRFSILWRPDPYTALHVEKS